MIALTCLSVNAIFFSLNSAHKRPFFPLYLIFMDLYLYILKILI